MGSLAIPTETVTNNVGHFVILKNPHERMGDHIRRSDEGWMRDIVDIYADKEKIALDIGSCFGLHSLYMGARFKRVLAFEPQKIIAELSRRTFFLNGVNNIQIFNVACSDMVGEVDFPAIDYSRARNVGGLSAAYDRGPDGNTNAGWDGASKMPLPSTTIDRTATELFAGETIGFIKIDVEGFEYKALKGAEQTLRASLCPLAIEIKDFPVGNLRKVHEMLVGIGYTGRAKAGNSSWDYLYTR